MEISPWVIYWISIMDVLSDAVCTVGLFGAMACAGVLIGCLIEDRMGWVRVSGVSLLVCVLIMFGSVFIPSSKALAAIYLLPKIANNQEIRGEAAEIYSLAKEWLADQVKEEK